MHYDLLVIGGGSGGVPAARVAASKGLKVGIIEEDDFGGTCVNRGCVPKKLYVTGSEFSSLFNIASSYGWDLTTKPQFSWNQLKQTVHDDIKRLNGIYESMLNKSGATIIKGRATFLSDTSVKVNDSIYTADKLLIAVGGKPNLPTINGIDYAISSNEAFMLETLPKSIAIVGGGYIALEFAGIFNSLGVDTHLIIRKDLPLRGFDHDIREFILKQLRDKGITVYTESHPTNISKTSHSLDIQLNFKQTISVEQVLMATGRNPNTAGLGLENTSVETTETGHIKTTKLQETTCSTIFAVGDVTTHAYDLTPYAITEARDWVERTYGNGTHDPGDTVVPTAVCSQPQIATVGLSEEAAIVKGFKPSIFTSTFRPMFYSLAKSSDYTYMKCVVDSETDRVLGIHIVGKDSAEMIQGFAVALRAGATKEHFDRTIGLHPSSAEELVTMREPAR